MIPISEIFGPTLQGEGALIGVPTVFVRTSYCDYRCSWCDTMYAVDLSYRSEWTPLSPGEIAARVRLLSGPTLVTYSGGNPAIHDSLIEVIHELRDGGYRSALETQGTIARPWFSELDHLTLSPKPPSAGRVTPRPSVERCLAAAGATRVTVKVVVFDEGDLDYLGGLRDLGVRVVAQVGTVRGDTPEDLLNEWRALAERVLAREWYDVTVLPQAHVLLWGNKRGV